MPVDIRVPVMGESVVEATISRWLKREGDPVKVGEPLVELETDKVNTQVSAEEPGVLGTIAQNEGATVRPGDVIGTINPGEAPAAAPSSTAAPASTSGAEGTSAAPTNGQASDAAPAAGSGVRATPLAQTVAEAKNVDLSTVEASGPGGKIIRADVEAAAGQGAGAGAPAAQSSARATQPPTATAARSEPAPAGAGGATQPAPAAGANGQRPETRQQLSRRRLTIARRLVEAQRTAAMLTTFNEVDMTAVMEIRSRRKESFKEQHGVGLGFMSFFTKAVVAALRAFPPINAELQGEELVLKQYYDIGVAIGDKEGLVVPVIRDADRLSFAQIEKAIQDYAQKSRDKALTIEDLRGGTFTITNGGVFGSLLSTPILNPPQVGILGMHKIEQRPVAVNGEVVIRPMMYLALSYDHRIVDGREAVQFLVRVKELLEDPERLLLEG